MSKRVGRAGARTAAAALAAACLLAGPARAAPAEDVGHEVYVQTCAVCHAKGTANAPRVNSRADWDARLALGWDALLHSVLKGKGGMPPKGGNASLSDSQARAALEHLLSRITAN